MLPGLPSVRKHPGCGPIAGFTTIQIDPVVAGFDREQVRLALETENIESSTVVEADAYVACVRGRPKLAAERWRLARSNAGCACCRVRR